MTELTENEMFYQKYLKYKKKYLELSAEIEAQEGGTEPCAGKHYILFYDNTNPVIGGAITNIKNNYREKMSTGKDLDLPFKAELLNKDLNGIVNLFLYKYGTNYVTHKFNLNLLGLNTVIRDKKNFTIAKEVNSFKKFKSFAPDNKKSSYEIITDKHKVIREILPNIEITQARNIMTIINDVFNNKDKNIERRDRFKLLLQKYAEYQRVISSDFLETKTTLLTNLGDFRSPQLPESIKLPSGTNGTIVIDPKTPYVFGMDNFQFNPVNDMIGIQILPNKVNEKATYNNKAGLSFRVTDIFEIINAAENVQ